MVACMQVALFAFGPGLFHPSEATAAVIRQCVHQAKDGRIPDAATKAITWITGPENKLPLAYEVDLRIIGSAILGASFVSYLLKVICNIHLRMCCVHALCARMFKVLVQSLCLKHWTWSHPSLKAVCASSPACKTHVLCSCPAQPHDA